MDSKEYKSINEAVMNGDFTSFNMLNENEKSECMKSWNSKMWDSYYLNDSINEDEVFNAVIKIIDEE